MNWHSVRVAKDATVKDKFNFESPGWWAITNVILSKDDDVLIYGTGLEKKKTKYFTPGVGMGTVDNIQIMKVSNGAAIHITNTD